MPWFDLRIAALVFGLMGPTGSVELPASAEVIVSELDVYDEPDDRSVASGRLENGDRVVVRAIGGDGWLTIDPPASCFLWIEQNAIDPPAGRGMTRVDVARAVVRSGIANAKLPGPPRGSLPQGRMVRFVDHPPLSYGGKTWRAIAPTSGEVRHIRVEGIAWVETPAAPVAESRASFSAEPALTELPPAVAAEIARIESSHRAIVRQSIEYWQLEPIRQRYQTLLKTANDPASTRLIQARIALVTQQHEASESARSLEATLAKSRGRDRKLALYLRRVAQAVEPQQRPYDAKGMIQPSSQKVDGQKVFALIGPKGTAVAYLNIPAGLDASRLSARNVGVRGSVQYNESLRARLITVHDLEPLDELRR